MKILSPYLICIPLLFIACSTQNEIGQSEADAVLVFQSGFENSVIKQRENNADLSGADPAFREKNDWIRDIADRPDFGKFGIQYHVGDSSMRNATIIPEPGNPGNHVMAFTLLKPIVNGSNGRIQANMYGNKGMKEFSQSVRIFLHEDFKAVCSYPGEVHWLTIAEFWNNITWNQSVPARFRITLGLGKAAGTVNNLSFILDAEDCELFADNSQQYTKIWAEKNESVAVPVGKWITMNYYYKEGDKQSGRFTMSIIPEGGKKVVVFDIHNITHNTTDKAPDGVSDLNPLKLYTSKALIEFMDSQNKTLQICWDDFKFWQGRRREL
ncbi:hypothetical protein [Flavitalea sp.]|nr:hypothetical protein [Flavitalea sp.]